MASPSAVSMFWDANPLHAVWNHLTTQVQLPVVDLTGRVCLVTGANQGLGYETAVHLVRMGADALILGCRDVKRGEEAAQKIRKIVPQSQTRIDVYRLDMASFSSVNEFVEQINSSLSRLDIAILNAGKASFSHSFTEDGFEDTLQINALTTGYLAWRLKPIMAKTSTMPRPAASSSLKPHITISGSSAHFMARTYPDFTTRPLLEAFNDPKHFGVTDDVYQLTKLLVVFMCRSMGQDFLDAGIILNNAHPGLCKSEVRRDLPRFAAYLFNLIAWTAEFGSRNYLVAALVLDKPGEYVGFGHTERTSALSMSKEGRALEKRYMEECFNLWREKLPTGLHE